MSSLDHARRLARIDVTRMLRKRELGGGGARAAVAALLYALLVLGSTLGGGYLAFTLGSALAAGEVAADPAGATAAARGVIGVVWVVSGVILAVRAVGQRGTLTNAEGILTVVQTEEAVGGLLTAEWVYLLLWALGPTVGVGVGLALGTGALWPAIGLPLALALVGAAAVTAGYAVGLTVRHVVTRFPFVARHKSLLIVVVFLAYLAAITTGSLNNVIVALFEPMAASPLGWFADLALLGVPGLAADPLLAAGSLATAAVLVAAGGFVTVRVARAHWFADPALAGEETPRAPTETPDDTLGRALERVLARPTGALVALAWRRAVRAPLKLLYAAYPLFFGVGIAADIVQTGAVPAYLPYGLLAFAAWAAGVAFTLNPLGDQGSVLSTTLISRVRGRQFVAAHLLAGLIVTVPLGTALVAAAGVLSPLAPAVVAGLTVATPVVMVAAAALSVGIGTAFPRFEATNVTRSMEAVVPSRWAFVLFSLHVSLTTVAVGLVTEPIARTVAAALVSFALPFGLTVSPDAVYWSSVVVLAALLVAPVASYRYAVRRFETYTLTA
ncbi:MAG: hypothetical protein ABEJ89_09045 [Haloarculaceae archaeon]